VKKLGVHCVGEKVNEVGRVCFFAGNSRCDQGTEWGGDRTRGGTRVVNVATRKSLFEVVHG